VSPILIAGLWRQRLASPLRVALAALWVLGRALLMGSVHNLGLTALGDGFPITLIFGVGMIGQDVSSGVLQLVFARPVRRWEYVLSRWAAVALGASALSLIQVALGVALAAARHGAPETSSVAWFLLGREFEIFGLAGSMALFSGAMGGVGDVLVYVLLQVGTGLLQMIGQFRQSEFMLGLAREAGALVSPRIEVAQFMAGSPSWFAIATYASNLVLCLCVAVWLIDRKELSYASG